MGVIPVKTGRLISGNRDLIIHSGYGGAVECAVHRARAGAGAGRRVALGNGADEDGVADGLGGFAVRSLSENGSDEEAVGVEVRGSVDGGDEVVLQLDTQGVAG